MSEQSPPSPRYTAEIGLRWGDMDAFGHVNNVQFHRLLEEARIRAFREWFHASGSERMMRSGVLLARQEIEYLHQLTYRPEPVHVQMWITRIGGASWEMAYEVVDGDPSLEVVFARAESTLVAFDMSAQQPRKLQEDERSALESYLGEPARMRRRR